MVCRRHQAPLSATIHTIQATHSQCHTLLNSYKMARPPLLRSHLLQYRRLMLLHPQVLFPAHCYHAVHSAHKSLWFPPDMAQVMTCRSLKAITQLSFLEFLQRCGVPIAPPQPSRPPVSISLQDATVQTTPPCDVSHQVSTQTSVQQDTLSCDVAGQTSFYGAHTLSLDAAAQTTSPSTLSQHVSTQMGSRSASSFSVDTSVQTPIRCVVQHDAATQLPLTEFFIGCIYSNSPLDRQNPVRQSPPSVQDSHVLPPPPPGLEQPVPPPELAAYSHLLTNVNSSSSDAQQSPVSIPAPKGVPVPPSGNP